jgi:hypothetical protein
MNMKKAEIERELLRNAAQREILIHKKRKLEEIDLPTPGPERRKKTNNITSIQLGLKYFFSSAKPPTTAGGTLTPQTDSTKGNLRMINLPSRLSNTDQNIMLNHTCPENTPSAYLAHSMTTDAHSPLESGNDSSPSPPPLNNSRTPGEQNEIEIIANKNEIEESKTPSSSSESKIIRVAWSKERKAEALKYLLSSSVISVFHVYDRKIPISTLYSWKNSNSVERKPGSGRRVTNPEFDEDLFEWFLTVRGRGVKVSDALLQKKAFDLCESHLVDTLINGDEQTHNNLLNLGFSRGWLEKFKKRWRIAIRRVTTTKIHPYDKLKKAAQSYFDDLDLHIVRYNLSVFYNMDETAVFFDLEEKTTLEIAGKKCVPIQGHQDAKKRCTVILTVGSNGEKLPPMVILKGNKTRLACALLRFTQSQTDKSLPLYPK